MDDYLSKPVEPGELAATLRRWMRLPATAGDRAPGTPPPVPEALAGVVGLDVPALLRRCNGRRELARRLILKFLEQAAADVDELGGAIERSDAQRLHQVAHRLKSAAANLAAEAVRQCADALEAKGREGDLAGAAELHGQLSDYVRALRETKVMEPA